MKIRHLHINNFGHFADRDIAFSDAGLQVIHGPNEAGKTTLLEFLRCWLFDFPARTPYDFKAGTEIAGVGTLLLGDGREVELRRRKGNKNKVGVKINGGETDLDETGFQRLIGHADRNLFESVFAFGLDRLSQGEESLKHESMQSALFGGGLGSAASPEQILDELGKQAAELFLPTARKPTINALLAELKDLAVQIKAKSLRSEDYHKLQLAVAAADSRAAEVHRQVNQLRRDHARVEKLWRAWPKWWELRQHATKRAPLAAPNALPADARLQFVSIGDRLAEADQECARCDLGIAKAARDLEALRLDPRAIALQAEIKACLQLRQSTVDARRDLPERIHQRNATREQIDRELNELRPGWGHGDLRAFSIDVATRAEIDSLAEQFRALSLAIAQLRAKREAVEAKLRDSKADLTALGEPRDTSALAAALTGESSYATDIKQHETRTGELAKADRQLSQRLHKLTPPLPPGAGSPHELPTPRIETIARFEAEFNDLREQLRAAVEAARENSEKQIEVQERLAGDDSNDPAPSLQDRDNRRRRRDAGWNLIRQRYVDLQPAPEDEMAWDAGAPGSLIETFEQSVRQADEIADQIYAKAEIVARREESLRQLDVAKKLFAHKQAQIDDLKRQEAQLHERWLAAWRPCGFQPLAPDAMRRWLADHEAVCETIARRNELAAEIEQLHDRKTTFEQRLRAPRECAEKDVVVAAEEDFVVILERAHRHVDEAKEHRRQTADLQRDIKRLQPQLAQCDADLAAHDESLVAWRGQWQSVLDRLDLPNDWNADLARTVIERLSATRVKLDGLPDIDARIAAMRSRIDEFEAKVRPLCEALAPELIGDPSELAMEKLSDQLGRAAEAQKRHDQLQIQRATALDQLKLAQDRQAKLLAARTDLFAAAEAPSEVAFLEVVSRAECIVRLDADIERLTREIELIRAGEDRDEFEQSLSQAEFETLESRRRDLAEQLETAERQKREADGAAAVAGSEVARLDGSGAAAALIDSLSRKRAQLAAEVDRYAPLLFARRLLADSVRRFDRENQPEMIATVSRLMNQMTAGRYTEFDRSGGERKTIVVRRRDGVERTPDQLSTGTREQLYLAIRLGYVLHYCRQNEPLPIVMDDVLVNFDPDRARNTLTALSDIAGAVQVLFFTCHPHLVSLAREVVPGLRPIDLSMPAASPQH